jgi:predicted O-linked N-acetylglucosamine transferase (SPINDLY family)
MQLGCIADIALDTSPVSGGTTTLHALWMGLPLVALRADEAAASASANTLAGLGYPEWVADDADGYLQRVLALIDSPSRLREHRATVRARMANSPLMDYPGRTRELEHAFRLMWINHLLQEQRFLLSNYSIDEAIESLPFKSGSSSAMLDNTPDRLHS